MRARRTEIMHAMAEVIAEKGYSAATLEDVAARMGASRAVIYYQFRSKEELYVELLVEAGDRATRRLREIIARGDSIDVTLKAALRDLLEVGTLPVNRATLATGYPRQLSREARQRVRDADRSYEDLLQSLVQQGMDQGVFAQRDAKLVTMTLIHGTNTSFLWRRPDGRLPLEYFLEELPAMLLNGVLAR
jgi:AcrR family transcriptional regulator